MPCPGARQRDHRGMGDLSERVRAATHRARLRRAARSIGSATRRHLRLRQWLRFLRHVARKELLLLVMPLLLVVGIFGFASVTEEVVEGDAIHFDEWAILALRDVEQAVGGHFLRDSARDITSLGSGVVLVIVTCAVAGWLAIRKSWHEVVLLLASLIGGVTLSLLLKGAFERERPALVEHYDVVSTYSFPSGHALLSAVVYLTLGAVLARLFSQRRVKLYLLGVASFLAFAVGLSRVFVGVHYPSDVLAGWCAGAAWASLCWLVTIFLQWRGDVARDAVTRDAPGAQPVVEEHPAPAT